LNVFFEKIPISFRCKSKVNDQIEFETRKYAKKEETDMILPEKDFEYTAYFEFNEEKNDPIVLFFNAKGICPQIKISQSNLDFKDCAMNERRDILFKIENKNEDLPLDFLFEKVIFRKFQSFFVIFFLSLLIFSNFKYIIIFYVSLCFLIFRSLISF